LFKNSSIYALFVVQVVVSLLENSPPSRVRAALSRDGVEVYGDHVNMQPHETRAILLQVTHPLLSKLTVPGKFSSCLAAKLIQVAVLPWVTNLLQVAVFMQKLAALC
jgi:hypothetical protein